MKFLYLKGHFRNIQTFDIKMWLKFIKIKTMIVFEEKNLIKRNYQRLLETHD